MRSHIAATLALLLLALPQAGALQSIIYDPGPIDPVEGYDTAIRVFCGSEPWNPRNSYTLACENLHGNYGYGGNGSPVRPCMPGFPQQGVHGFLVYTGACSNLAPANLTRAALVYLVP